MAFGGGTLVGSANNKTAGTSAVFTLNSGNISAGSLLVAIAVIDNVATVDGASSNITSVSDSKSNTWTKIAELTNTQAAAAADGVTIAAFVCVVTNALSNLADTITLNHSSVTARAFDVHAFTKGAGTTIAVDGSVQNSQSATAALTASSLSNVEHLAIDLLGVEGVAVGETETGWTAITAVATSGGSATTNVSVAGKFKIAAASTSVVSTPTSTASGDLQRMFFALKEVSGTTYNDNLTESAAAASSLANAETFNPTEAESAAAADSLNPAGSTFGVPLSESAAAQDSVSSTQTFVNTLAENAGAADSVNGGLLVAGSLNEAAQANDNLTTAMTFAPALSEAAAANDALASQATFTAPLAESAAAAVAQSAQQTFVSSLGESAAAADSVSSGLLTTATLNETVGAQDATTTTATFAWPLTEASAAQDQVASQAVMGSGIGESAGAADAISGAATMPNTLGESAGAGDQAAASQVFNEQLTETGAAAVNLGADGTTNYNDVISETLAPGLTLGVGLQINAVLTEQAAATDQVDATAVIGASVDEQTTPIDQATASAAFGAGLDEGAAAGDDYAVELIARLTHQSTVLQAMKDLVIGALPDLALGFTADFRKPTRTGQREIGRPQRPFEVEYELGGTYAYRMGVDIVLTAVNGSGGAVLDDMGSAIGAAVAADRTLGGLADWLEAKAARPESRSMRGIASSNFATVTIVAEFRTRNALAA